MQAWPVKTSLMVAHVCACFSVAELSRLSHKMYTAFVRNANVLFKHAYMIFQQIVLFCMFLSGTNPLFSPHMHTLFCTAAFLGQCILFRKH